MLYFVRHGSTNWNQNYDTNGIRDPKMQGKSDIPLNENGIQQAKDTAATLEGIKFDKIYCSPLTRAKQTCAIINKDNQDVIYDARIMERDFGEYESHVKSSFDFARFWNDLVYDTYEKAETVHEMKKRVYEFLDDILASDDENILVVAHGGVGMLMYGYFHGIPEDGDYLRYLLPNGQATKFNTKK